jgi:hypothetical protein
MVSVVLKEKVRRDPLPVESDFEVQMQRMLAGRVTQYLKSWYEGALNLETSLFIYSGKSLFSTRDYSLRSNKKRL